MKRVPLTKLDLDIYYDKLENGLEVFIVPKKNISNKYVTFSTKYGSIYNEFVPIQKDQMIKVPDGIAHFLEHKLFEQEDGVDPFTFFSERGADANANTWYYKTTYLFTGTNFLEENLTYLLDYVQSPYFTDENVKKEQGIIEQEIEMYQDNPYSRLDEQIMYNAFVKHPIRYSVIGTVKEVNSITKEDLYTCYNTFYHPSNMFVVVVGDVEPESVINLIKENQSKKKFPKSKKIKVKDYDEPDKVFKKYDEIVMDNITIPKVSIAYKINKNKFSNLNEELVDTYIKLLFDIKMGATSSLNEKLKEEHILTDDLYFYPVDADDHILIIISAETEKTKELIDLVTQELKKLEVTEEEVERKKKALLSFMINLSDNIYGINEKIMNDVIKTGEVIDNIKDQINLVNIEDINYVIDNINLNNYTVGVVKGKK